MIVAKVFLYLFKFLPAEEKPAVIANNEFTLYGTLGIILTVVQSI